MEMYSTYEKYNITIESAKGAWLYDNNNNAYLDFYGGHGVISIGHSHPYYIDAINAQLNKITFYSNSIEINNQNELARKMSEQSGYNDYKLFLCNSGTEANENALKLASHVTGKRKVLAFKNSFHGRTAAAYAVTDCKSNVASLNKNHFPVTFIDLNSIAAAKKELSSDTYCAVIIEGIQGIGGLDYPNCNFLLELHRLCKNHKTVLILDEIQSGYGRSGHFFAHQHCAVQADIVTVAKGMGNGFPIGGLLIHPSIHSPQGFLGTTFGGNHLACSAACAVLDILASEQLIDNCNTISSYLKNQLIAIPQIQSIKGKGLMLGLEFNFPIKKLRENLLFKQHVFTGNCNNEKVLRILPPLSINKEHADYFIQALKSSLI